MPEPIIGLHHVTAIASSPQRNLDFYTEVLGLRLVKRTINFDDPGTYHFYFGDDLGTPGTILTFFPWPHASRGRTGIGETSAVAFLVSKESLLYWQQRLLEAGVAFEHGDVRFGDPVLRFTDSDGLHLELIGQDVSAPMHAPRTATVPPENSIRGFSGVTLCEAGFEGTTAVLAKMGFVQTAQEGNRYRFSASGSTGLGAHVDVLVQTQLMQGRMGAGSVHHIAFRAPNDAAQLEWRQELRSASLDVTPVMDRTYFHSIYFREPGGVLFEIATDPPGFLWDEPVEALGEHLKLPPWLEDKRSIIERMVEPITLHHQRNGDQ